jgi:hypothetical protein
MSFRSFSRIRALAISLAAVTATSTLVAIAGAVGPAAAATSNGCPASKTLAGLPTASNVAANFTNTNTTTSTYTFSSVSETSTSLGVPGLIKYCVYPGTPLPDTISPKAHGANGAPWVSAKGSNNFAFVRPGGDKTNIPLDGKTGVLIGTATWSAGAPTSQTIILHINDPTVCQRLFPGSTTGTCFVKPGTLGPRCDTGDTNVAYNDMPFDVVNCLNPGVAFEAHPWNEFGDSVTLSSTGGTLKSLIVDFQSFACVTGTWNNQGGNNLCAGGTTTGVSPGTFTWPITANIYAVDSSGLPTTLLATTGPVDEQIPFRPNADPTNCGGSLGTPEKWFNPLAPNGGACQNSIATKLTFDFSGLNVTLSAGEKVAWTVAFNTSTQGYTPQGNQTPPCNLPPATASTTVCPQNPADSLNVGDKTYTTPPFAGTSLFDTSGNAVGSQGPTPAPLGFFTPDDTGRPLGEIITS